MKTFEQFIESRPEREYWSNGNLRKEIWLNEKGQRYREKGLPAVIYYYKNGNIEIERWYEEGKQQREKGPSAIHYYEDGNIKREFWYKDTRRRHREDGPAYILYDKNGNIQREDYYLNGKEYTNFEDWLEDLQEINPEQYKIQKQKKEFRNLGI